jgi:predicted PolB exonuclease-like 3'-5' exonuclease
MGASDARREEPHGFLIFDIETRIDKALLRQVLFPGAEISDELAYQRERDDLRRRSEGREFFPVSFHVPVSIALGEVDGRYRLTGVEVWGADRLGDDGLAKAFWCRLESFEGTLVSFNGRGFDLPVLELQALRYGCAAPRYFNERNGLRARFGRHFDLFDFLTNSGAARLRGGLDLLARLVGLPGKGEVSGGDVQGLWESGRFELVHRYCRDDVIQTYFLFLHVEHLCGRLSGEELREAEAAGRRFRDEVGAR